MAGGIDWFRWHHGSVVDPKFLLIARQAGARLGDVIATWAFALESASANADRGVVGNLDAEALDCLLGVEDGTAQRILQAMRLRRLIDAAGHVVAWEKRQPKREDETANDRKRRQREREQEAKCAARVTGESSRDVTQGHAEVTLGHARGEERKVDGKHSDAAASHVASDADDRLACPHQKIIDAWAEILPELPAVRQWGAARARSLQTRWREQCKAKGWASQDEGVAWFRRLFQHIRRSAFLMGQSGRGDGHEAWQCTLPWLCKAEYFARVLEGHYHREAA